MTGIIKEAIKNLNSQLSHLKRKSLEAGQPISNNPEIQQTCAQLAMLQLEALLNIYIKQIHSARNSDFFDDLSCLADHSQLIESIQDNIAEAGNELSLVKFDLSLSSRKLEQADMLRKKKVPISH